MKTFISWRRQKHPKKNKKVFSFPKQTKKKNPFYISSFLRWYIFFTSLFIEVKQLTALEITVIIKTIDDYNRKAHSNKQKTLKQSKKKTCSIHWGKHHVGQITHSNSWSKWHITSGEREKKEILFSVKFRFFVISPISFHMEEERKNFIFYYFYFSSSIFKFVAVACHSSSLPPSGLYLQRDTQQSQHVREPPSTGRSYI